MNEKDLPSHNSQLKHRILRLSEGDSLDREARRSLDLKVHISPDIKVIPPTPRQEEPLSSDSSIEKDDIQDVDEIDGAVKPNIDKSPDTDGEASKFGYHQDSIKKYKRMLSSHKEEQLRKVSKVEEGDEIGN